MRAHGRRLRLYMCAANCHAFSVAGSLIKPVPPHANKREQGTVPPALLTLPLEQLNISTNELQELPAGMGSMTTLKVGACCVLTLCLLVRTARQGMRSLRGRSCQLMHGDPVSWWRTLNDLTRKPAVGCSP